MSGVFTQSLKSRQGDSVYLVHGGVDETKRPAWYFVCVDSPKVQAFLRAIKSGIANLEEYGRVLESGYGEAPPETVVEMMRKHYGYTG